MENRIARVAEGKYGEANYVHVAVSDPTNRIEESRRRVTEEVTDQLEINPFR